MCSLSMPSYKEMRKRSNIEKMSFYRCLLDILVTWYSDSNFSNEDEKDKLYAIFV